MKRRFQPRECTSKEVTRKQVTLLLSLQTNTFTGLIWLYGDTKSAGPVEFALKLLNKLEIHHYPLEKTQLSA